MTFSNYLCIECWHLFFFCMLAQSYTPNIHNPPLYRNFFIKSFHHCSSPITTVSIPICPEPCTHPPVEPENGEAETFTQPRRSQSKTRSCLPRPRPYANPEQKGRKTFCNEAQLSQKVKSKLNYFLSCVSRSHSHPFTAQVHACRARNRQG